MQIPPGQESTFFFVSSITNWWKQKHLHLIPRIVYTDGSDGYTPFSNKRLTYGKWRPHLISTSLQSSQHLLYLANNIVTYSSHNLIRANHRRTT